MKTIKQQQSEIETTFLAEDTGGSGSKNCLKISFPSTPQENIEFTFYGTWELQEFLMQMQNIINELKDSNFWNGDLKLIPPKVQTSEKYSGVSHV